MKLLIGLLIGFVILVYVYNYLKLRKRRQDQTDTVARYRRRYRARQQKQVSGSRLDDSNYKKYVTKYNSKTDYISKDDLFL